MVSRTVLVILGAFSSFALAPESHAQQSAPAPSYDRVQEFSRAILDDALATSLRADSYAQQNNFFQATQEYETFLRRSEGAPELLATYPVHMALAGAHLEAAFNRVMNASRSPDFRQSLQLREQNQIAINRHIGSVYPLVWSALRHAGATTLDASDKAVFACAATEKFNAAMSLHGIVNSIPDDVEKGIKGYMSITTCSPGAKRAVQYLKEIKKNISGGLTSSDAIASMTSRFAKETAPGGTFISAFITIGYDFYKKSRPSAAQILPR